MSTKKRSLFYKRVPRAYKESEAGAFKATSITFGVSLRKQLNRIAKIEGRSLASTVRLLLLSAIEEWEADQKNTG